MDRKILEKIGKFLETPGKRLLFYHHDADGICSAALLLKFFGGFEAIPREGPRAEEGFLEDIIRKKPNLLVFLDIPIDQEWKALKKIQAETPKLRVLIIDHHIPEKDLNSQKITHYNPMFRKNVYIPTAFLMYEILESLGKDVKPYKWIAGMGIIGDYGFRECGDFLECLKRERPGILRGEPFSSNLGKATELISYAITLKGLNGARESLDLLVKQDEFGDFAKNPKLNIWKKEVGGEIRKILDRFESEKVLYKKIGLAEYAIKSRLNLTSIISTILAKEHPDYIVMAAKESRKGFKVSIRCQGRKLNLGELTKRAVKGIGSGGGHEKAAGALVRDFELFRERFVKLVSKTS